MVTAQTSALPTPLSYEAAVGYALAHNLAVDAARRGRAIREANIRAAGQRPNPAFDAEASRDTPHQTLTFEFPIEIGSQRSRRIDVANGELLLADVDVQAGMRIVRRQLREQFFGLLAADERVRLAESVVEIATRVRDAAQARFDAGAVPRLEVMQADLGVSRAEAELEAARSERAAAQATLNGVLNAPPQQALTLEGSLADHTAAPSFTEATAIAATSNTDLVGLDRQIEIEARRLELLRAQRTPVPTFSIAALFNAPGDFGVAPSASVNVGLPIFSRNQGEIAASIATTVAAPRTARCDPQDGGERGLRGNRTGRGRATAGGDLPAASHPGCHRARVAVGRKLSRRPHLGPGSARRPAQPARSLPRRACRPLSTCRWRSRNWRISLGRRSPSRTLALAGTLAAVLLLHGCARSSDEGDTARGTIVPTIAAEVGKVTRGTIADDLVVRGTIAALPNEDVKVSALVGGRVDAVTVAEGDSVRAGQVVARIDTRTIQDQQKQAEAARQTGSRPA